MNSQQNQKSRSFCKRTHCHALAMVAATLWIAVLGACATGISFYQRSYDVTTQFERGIVLENHSYYVGGPTSKPNAIVAITANYTLESEHWRQIHVTSESLRKTVSRIGHVVGAEYKKNQMIHNGARMIAPDGSLVGFWYSVYDYSQVRISEGNRIYLSFPPAHLPNNVRIPGFERDLPMRY